jgi:SAM-dependent methyltransferase
MSDHAVFVRETMRQRWGARSRAFAEHAAPQTAMAAELLIAMVKPAPGERALDVATGSGVVALRAAAAVGPTGQVVATDLAPEWGEIVAEESAKAGLDNVIFRTMGAEELALPDGSFDLALCQFGLMFVPDPVRALREMRRVLRVGGRLGLVVWSTRDKVPLFTLCDQLNALVPPSPTDQALPAPTELGAPGLIERHVADAGFTAIAVERRTLDYTIADPQAEWHFRLGPEGGPLVTALNRLPARERTALHDAFLAELETYRRDGVVRLPCEAIYLTAVR